MAAAAMMGVLAGCGGGNGSGEDDTPPAATFIPGAYAAASYCGGGDTGTVIDSSNTVYTTCTTKLLVGKITGTAGASSVGQGALAFTVYDAGAPATTMTVGTSAGPVTVQVPAGKATVSDGGTLAGTLFFSNDRVTQFFFSPVAGSSGTAALNATWAGAAPARSIMGAWSTMAGNFVRYLPEKLANDASETLSISADGVIAGATSLGTVGGQVTAFHAATGVHDVRITLTPPSGTPVAMTGVIGPYDVNMTGSTLYANYSGLLLAVTGDGRGFYRIFRHP